MRVINVSNVYTYIVAPSVTSFGHVATVEMISGTQNASGSIMKITADGVVIYVKLDSFGAVEIIHFIESTPPQLRVQALELLKTISEKDLRDTPATVLLDHLQNTPVSKNPLSTKYILNPRIAYEMLTPYKLFFQKAIDST